jgi:proteasome accessory factor B
MQKNKSQLLRLVFIDNKIRQGMRSGILANCKTMAEEYEVSAKSIIRDIDYLKHQWGAPIEYAPSRHGYYYTEENYAVPALNLTESDLFAIHLAQEALRQYAHLPSYKQLESFLSRIEQSLPAPLPGAGVETTGGGISLLGGPQTNIDPTVWGILAKGVRSGRRLKLSHKKAKSKKLRPRLVDPYHIFSYQGEWYLAGFCHERQKILTFAASRIAEATILPDVFTIPTEFNFETYMQDRFGLYGESGNFHVQMRFDDTVSPYIRERQWHPSQKITTDEKGGILVEFRVGHLLEIKRWLLSWGNSVTAIAPQQLRDEIMLELEAARRRYD